MQVRQLMRQSAAVAAGARRLQHFTRNEGVPGSSPGVGFTQKPTSPCSSAFSIASAHDRCGH